MNSSQWLCYLYALVDTQGAPHYAQYLEIVRCFQVKYVSIFLKKKSSHKASEDKTAIGAFGLSEWYLTYTGLITDAQYGIIFWSKIFLPYFNQFYLFFNALRSIVMPSQVAKAGKKSGQVILMYLKSMYEWGTQKIISIRTLNHFTVWNFPIQGLSSGNFRYKLPVLMWSKFRFESCLNLFLKTKPGPPTSPGGYTFTWRHVTSWHCGVMSKAMFVLNPRRHGPDLDIVAVTVL